MAGDAAHRKSYRRQRSRKGAGRWPGLATVQTLGEALVLGKRFSAYGMVVLGALLALAQGALPAAPPVPNERLLNPDVAVYRRSATELWVYDTRPEAGVGAHAMDAQTLTLIRALGVRLVRHTMYWNQIEPTETPGQYDAKRLAEWDDVVARCGRAGIVPVIVVHGNPPGVDFAHRQAGYQRFARFMAAMAARYPSVRFWELWTEMDQAFTDLFGAGKAEIPLRERGKLYAEMLKVAYPAIKKANPRAWVLAGGMSDWSEFPRGIYEGGGRDFFDFMNLHTYGVPVRYAFVGRGLALYSVMKEFGDEGRPLWNTEFGIDAGNVVNAWGVPHARKPPEEDGPSFDAAHLATWKDCLEDNARRRLYVKTLGYQFAAGNETARERTEKEARLPAGRGPDDYGFGLVRADGKTPRPAYDWLKARAYNAPLTSGPDRVMDIELYVPDGATPVGHTYEYQWREPWVLIKGVKVGSLEPTVIHLNAPTRPDAR
jgi:hypothetical protein